MLKNKRAKSISLPNLISGSGSGIEITTWSLSSSSKVLSITTGVLGTSSSALTISSSNALTNTDGVIKVVNTAASGASIFATLQANVTSGLGLTILNNGNVGIGTNAPTEILDLIGNKIRLRTPKTPTSSTDTCNTGDIAWDRNYIYVCVATNSWKRTALVENW